MRVCVISTYLFIYIRLARLH